MSQPRDVVLNYDPANPSASFGPSPRLVSVSPNDTIHFRLSESAQLAHPHCRLRITLHNPAHFSQGTLQHGPGQSNALELVLTVLSGITAGSNNVITAYKCELLDVNGNLIPGLTADGDTGGDIVPASGAA